MLAVDPYKKLWSSHKNQKKLHQIFTILKKYQQSQNL
jgi:hypothetical protein